MSDLDVDLLVVGAGPAGIAAGITARDRGLDTLVIDKAGFGRDKTCGDGLTAAALRTLEALGLPIGDLDPALAPVDTAVLVSPSGRRVALPLPTGPGHHAVVVPRARLDAALVALAQRRGVDVREHTALAGLKEEPDRTGIVAELADGGVVRARHVVAADGTYSPTRKLLRPDAVPALGEWSAFRQYFTGVDDPKLWVLFEQDLLPGYAWVFPLPGGRANVGFGVLRGPGVDGKWIKATWRDLLTRASMRSVLGANAEPEAPHRAWPIPTAYDPERLVDGRVLFAGDAASVVDPLTGEGIAQALETGVLAADAVAHGNNSDVATRYRSAVHRTLGRDLRFAGALQQIVRRPIGARAAIRAADLTPWTRRNFARWMFEDYPRALVLTPDRWDAWRVHRAGRVPQPHREPPRLTSGSGGHRRSARLDQDLDLFVGSGERVERGRHTLDADGGAHERTHVEAPLGDRLECRGELHGVVPEHELDRELLHDADHRPHLVDLHAHPRDHDPGLRRCVADGRVEHPAHADGFEDHEWTAPRDPPPRVDRGFDNRIDDDVRAHLLGEGPAQRREVGRDDRFDALQRERRDRGEADRAAAQHDRAVARLDLRLVHRMEPDGHRFGERSPARVETVGDLHADPRSDPHAFRVSPAVGVRVSDGFDPAGRERDRDRDDEVTRLHRDAVGLGTELQDLRAELVTHHEIAFGIERRRGTPERRHLHHRLRVHQRVQVGSADAARPHGDERVARTRLGFRDVLHHELTTTGDCCEHPASFARDAPGRQGVRGQPNQAWRRFPLPAS